MPSDESRPTAMSMAEQTEPDVAESQSRESSPVATAHGDHISPVEDHETVCTAVQGMSSAEETPSPSKKDAIRVHVSRRSTETGDSKGSKRGLRIQWPNTKQLGPGIHWYTPTMMITLAFAGLFGGLGHHLYNAGLKGQPVIDAQWPQRWGVAMAFFVKMTLVGAVQIAVKQRAWLTVKKRGFRVRTLDSIFHGSAIERDRIALDIDCG
ncbi:hypothetical protein GE09DRAFT_1059936 [Coniochaeta sp. 2T2.1]|nr:hypothetical protein GE09DRAFT_1059936 [Coniochaeta sp. 2T2.1]